MIQGVQIQLRGSQMVGMPSGGTTPKERNQLRWEEHVVLDRTLRFQENDNEGHTVREQGSRGRSLKERIRDKATGLDDPNAVGAVGLFLERGVHDFEFHFIIPAWTAPYERCKYGRTRYTITATALGAGRGGAGVTAQREAFVIQQQTADGGPYPLEMQYHDVHEALGLISIGLTSASLTVGGIATLALVHPNPPPNVNVHLVRVFVEQKYELYNHQTASWVSAPLDKLRVWDIGTLPRTGSAGIPNSPALWAQGVLCAAGIQPSLRLGAAAVKSYPMVQPLEPSLEVDERPLAQVPDAGKYGYRIKTVVRLPDDNRLRPTTARGTRTDIRITHELGVEVLFSRTDVLDDRVDSEMYGQPKVQVFSMAKPVSIPSCAFTFDSIHLPPYSEESPVSCPASPSHTRQRSETSTGASGITTQTRTPPNGGALASEPEWNRLIHSLTNSLSAHTIRSHVSSRTSSRAASRDPSPTRLGFRSRPNSRPPSPPADGPSGATTPVYAVLRPNDLQRPRSGPALVPANDRSAPRNLPAGSPWAVSHLPPRIGESHDMCNCGQPTDRLIEAEERFVEGAPTAPGAWIDTASGSAVPPPWTPTSRPTSPTREWLSSYTSNVVPATVAAKDESPPVERVHSANGSMAHAYLPRTPLGGHNGSSYFGSAYTSPNF